jgi:hypothetical protein
VLFKKYFFSCFSSVFSTIFSFLKLVFSFWQIAILQEFFSLHIVEDYYMMPSMDGWRDRWRDGGWDGWMEKNFTTSFTICSVQYPEGILTNIRCPPKLIKKFSRCSRRLTLNPDLDSKILSSYNLEHLEAIKKEFVNLHHSTSKGSCSPYCQPIGLSCQQTNNQEATRYESCLQCKDECWSH